MIAGIKDLAFQSKVALAFINRIQWGLLERTVNVSKAVY